MIQIFFKAMDRIGTETLPGLLPGFKFLACLSLVLGFVNPAGLLDTVPLVFFLAVTRNILKFVKPAALDLGFGIEELRGGLQAWGAVHDNEF